MRVAIYTRVSTRDKGQDVLNQVTPIRNLCVQEGWDIWREYEAGPVVVSILTSLPKRRLILGSKDKEALPLKNDGVLK